MIRFCALLLLAFAAPLAAQEGALAEVNAVRVARGLQPFTEDAGLTKAAKGAAEYRAARRIEGHTDSDFKFLPAGTAADAAGCAAWEPGWGWGACCTYEGWKFAGAAFAVGSDGRRYMHLFVREGNGGGSTSNQGFSSSRRRWRR